MLYEIFMDRTTGRKAVADQQIFYISALNFITFSEMTFMLFKVHVIVAMRVRLINEI